MNNFFDLIQYLSQDADGTVSALGILLRVTAILVLGMLIALSLRRASAALRHWVWALSLFAVILLPIGYGVFPSLHWAILPPQQEQASLPKESVRPRLMTPVQEEMVTELPPSRFDDFSHSPSQAWEGNFDSMPRAIDTPAVMPVKVVSENVESPVSVETLPAVTPVKATSSSPSIWSWAQLLAVLWGIGMVLGLVWLIIGIVAAWHITRRAKSIASSDWSGILQQLTSACGFRRPVAVRESNRVSVPMTWGLRRPMILVPAGSGTWSEATKRSVLLHELGHIRRGDCLTRLLGRLACVVYWFHPLVWLADRQLRKTSEQAADDVVLSSNIAPPDYAEQLLGIVAQLRSNRLFGHVVLPMASKSDLEGRMLAILDSNRNRRVPKRKTCYALIVLATLALVPCAMLRLGYAEPAEDPTTSVTGATEEKVTIPETESKTTKETKNVDNFLAEKSPDDLSMTIQAIEAETGKAMSNVAIKAWYYFSGEKKSHIVNLKTNGEGKSILNCPGLRKSLSLNIDARVDGFVPQHYSWMPHETSPVFPETLVIKFEPATLLKGQVLDELDQPVGDSKVIVTMRQTFSENRDSVFDLVETRTDKEGRWSTDVAPENLDKVSIYVEHPDFAKDSGKRALDLRKQGKYISRLHHGITVGGHVLDFENKPIQGATVSVAPKTYCTDKDKEVKTDAKGYFQIEHCPLGFIVVTIQADGFAPQVEKLQLNGNVLTLKAQLKPGGKICGRVVDLQKNPLKDVHVAVASWQDIRTLKFRTKTDEEGRFVWESAPHGIANFDFFGAKGFMAERNRPLASFSEEQTVYLNPELVIRGTVTDEATGEPIKPIHVCLGRRSKGMPELDFSNGLRYEKNGNQYELRVNEPTPGIYVKIEADGYQPTTSREFKPNEGEQTYDFKLKKIKTKAKSTAGPTIVVTPKTVVQSDAAELSPVERSKIRWEVAEEFQKSMKGKRFQEAVVHFAPELKKELPAAELEKLWRKLVGPQGEIHYSRVRRAKRFGKIWLQSIQFDAMAVELETLLAFDEQNRINGLRIVCNKGRQKFPDFPERGYMFGDAIKEATHANLTLKAIVVGLDGKPIEDDEKSTEEATSGGWKMQKRRASIWMAVEREVDNRRDHHWHDPVTGKLWRWIGSGEEKNLSPGLYRAVALPQRYSNSPPPIGMSEVVELDGSQKHTEVNVPIKTGPTLSLNCVDAKTGKPSEPVHITVINTSGHLPPDTRFGVNEKVSSIKLENLPTGTYTVTANTRVSRPDEPQYRLENGQMEIKVVAGQDQEITLPIIKALMTEEAIAQRWRWVVQGRVTDEKGQPVEGASVWVHSGIATCFRTGITETGKDGQYTLRFGPGAMMSSPKPGEVPIGQLVASVSVHKPGFTEKNLSRQGGQSMANRLPTPEEEKQGVSSHYGKTKPILPNDPVTIDFVMVPAATVDVELVDAEGKPVSIPEKSLGLSGETRPPGCSVLKSGEKADGEYFHVEDVPPDYAWWFYLNTEPRKKIRTPEMTFSQAETYRVQLRTAKRASGDEYLEVVSVKNAQGEDVREQVLAGNTPTTLRPSADKVAPPELVETMRKTNRPWLKPDPKHLSYTFAMEHPGKDDRKEYKVQYASSGTASIQEVGTSEKLGYSRVTMLQGTSMFGPLQAWALSPKDSHTLNVVGEATIDGVDAWVLHLKKRQDDSGEPQRFSVAVGCGLARNWYGYSSYKVDLDQIWVDKATGRILREEAFTKDDGFYQKKASFVATYGDFVKTPDGGQAPRQVEVQLWSNPSSAWVFKMQFQLVDGKTWLLKELEEIQGGKLSAVATVSDATAESLADPATIIEGVGWGEVRVGITRENLIKALGKPDGDPNSSILRWSAKHLECTFHVGSTVVSEVRFNQGFREALSNGIKLGAPGNNVLKEYGEPEYVIDPRNGAKEYEYSSKGILFWTNQEKVTQIVVFKPYHLKKKNNTSPELVRLDKGLAKEYQPLPNDEKLTEEQRLYCRWDAKQFGVPTAKRWEKLSEVEKVKEEERFLKLLKDPSEAERVRAIDALVGLGSKKAVAPILEIAADRKEKNNWDRHTACRALGMLGDKIVVPELVHLTYHFNWNTRLWAQISLVRLTGQNFGNDVKAWKAWWDGQGGQPPISEETVAWATSQWMLSMLKGLEDPKKQEEHDRRMIQMMKQQLEKKLSTTSVTAPSFAKSLREYQPLPNDDKLTENQRLYCRWDAVQFGVPDPSRCEKLSDEERSEAEERLLKLLKDPNEQERVRAIDALVGIGSKKAVAPILEIAADRKEKNNWDRHTACRALGMLGDKSVVPELVHLTYHFNWNTRLWAQISLVRLTGQNFGNDVKAWKAWWDEQGGQPPISEETVAWATSQWMLAMLKGYEDPAKQKEYDRRMIKTMKQRLGETSPSSKPTSPDPKEEAAPKTSQTSTKPKTDATEPPPALLTAFGKVLDPAGKPVAGATVYLREWSTYRVSSQPYLQDKKIDDILAKTQTDAEGKFEFKNIPAKPLSSQWLENIPWDVVVEAKPYALAWQHLSAAKQSEPMTITLVADQEITGQVTDQQGMPVPDAKVEVFGIAPVGSGPDCSAYADPEVLDLQWSRMTPEAKTDAEGNVSLRGVPKNKQVRLRVAHDDFRADVIYVATTNKPQPNLETSSFNYQTRKPITKSKKIFSNDFSVALEPPLPRLVGRIVAADTKKPLSQINISQYGSNGVLTDQDGQFTLKSIRGKNCRLLILAPKAGNYLGRVLFVDVPDDKKETRIDIELERGENLSGMVVDEETGKGVANVYVGFETDYDLNTATEPGVLPTNYKTGNDGRFRLTVPPVEGKVKIFGSELGYDLPRPSGNPEDIEGFFREVEVIAGKPTEEIKFTLRRLASEEKKKTPLVRREWYGQYLTKARKPVNRMVEGKVIDPDGKPVAGALVGLEWGMNHLRENDPLVQSDQEGAFSFKLKRDPYREENLVAIDQKRKLRGHVRISNPSQEENINTFWEIYLVPTGVVKGRVMEGDEPLADAEVQLDARALRKDSRGNWPLTSHDHIRTDKDGYFEFSLVEGDCQIDLHVHPEGYTNATCQGELAAGGTYEAEPFTVMKLNKTVGGTVVDPDGKPVEGVTVTAEPYSNPTIHHQAWNRNATGKDGRFVIHGVPDVPLTLNAHIRLDGQVLRNSVQTKAEPGALEVKIVFDPK